MFKATGLIGITVISFCGLAKAEDLTGMQIKHGQTVTIVPTGRGLAHTMLQMVRHPDGTIYLNTHRGGLYYSTDDGQSWNHQEVNLPDAPPYQNLCAFGVTRDGRLLLGHQTDQKWIPKELKEKYIDGSLRVSTSDDGGKTWETTQVYLPNLKYTGTVYNHDENLMEHVTDTGFDYAGMVHAYGDFFQQPDGTVVFSVPLMTIEHGGCHMLIRSRDGGKTWSDVTCQYPPLNACECSHSVDPNDPDHILSMARTQRKLLAGEDRTTVEKRTGCPPGSVWVYKQGLMIESTDGGRTFQPAPGGLTDYYGHRGTIIWTKNNTLVVTHQGGVRGRNGGDYRVVARISPNGGKTWLDGTSTGTPSMNQSTKFEIVPKPPGHDFTSPTVEISPDHFFTAYFHDGQVSGVFWHLEK